MKLAVNICLSLLMLAGCVWLVWPNAEQQVQMRAAWKALDAGEFAPYLIVHLLLTAVTHFCRAWRWNNLLEPIGVKLAPARLLAISSVGFMAIIALPARLGEFVRPALIRKKGEVSAAAALGTIAVERVIDGLLISVFVFVALFAIHNESSPAWMMPMAWTALGIFTSALVFLVFALRWPEQTVQLCVKLSLVRLLAPAIADKIEEKLLQLISGFLVLKDKRNLFIFVLWSMAYWSANSLNLWVLAKGFGLDLPLVGAFATLGIVAVGITLPNSPGLIGQYQYFVVLGLGLYLGTGVAETTGLVFAVALHATQVTWFLAFGAIALATKHVSFKEVLAARGALGEDDETTSRA
jgi:uncharacterized protein (TIRG00374 family)